jgi:hypothetical protein
MAQDGIKKERNMSAWQQRNNLGNDTLDQRTAHLDPSSSVVCTRAADSLLDTVTLFIGVGERKMRFVLDSGADLCLCKHGSIKEGIVYNSARSVNVNGVSNVIENMLGERVLKLSIEDYETS